MEKLIEKATCKDCGCVEHRELKAVNKETINISGVTLTAIGIKKFECSECGSTDNHSEIVKVDQADTVA
jgi:hypothetical protein